MIDKVFFDTNLIICLFDLIKYKTIRLLILNLQL